MIFATIIFQENMVKMKPLSLSEILYYKQVEYIDQKGTSKKKKDKTSSPVLYVKLIYSSDTKKFSTLFRVKGKKEVKPLERLSKTFSVFPKFKITQKIKKRSVLAESFRNIL